MYYKLGLEHYYYYFRVCSNKYYCLLKNKFKSFNTIFMGNEKNC